MNKLKMGTLQQVKEEIVVCSKWEYLICTLKGPIFKCSNVRNDYKLKSEIKIKNPQVQWIIIIIIVIIFNICDSSPNTLSPVKSDHRLTNIYCIITFNKQTNKQNTCIQIQIRFHFYLSLSWNVSVSKLPSLNAPLNPFCLL